MEQFSPLAEKFSLSEACATGSAEVIVICGELVKFLSLGAIVITALFSIECVVLKEKEGAP